jgi:hypothetical protein
MRFLTGVVVVFCLTGMPGITAAQSNPELIDMLNTVLEFQIKTLRQCEVNSDHYKGTVLYLTIMGEKEENISILKEFILQIGGNITAPAIIVDVYPAIAQSFNRDARNEIDIIRACDALLAKYGHPKARQIVQTARDRSLHHYMLFTNAAQAFLVYDQSK